MPAPSDLVHETTTGTGTGNLDLVNVSGKRSFNTAFGNGAPTNVFDYFISHRSAAEWERGTGHMSDADTLVRDTVIASSNANAAVNFAAGTKDVTNDIPAGSQLNLSIHPRQVNKQVFEASGTFTTPATSSTATVYRYRMVAGGGGGGGVGGSGSNSAAGGGGTGGYVEGTFTGVAASTGITITVGAGGTAGSSAGGNGGNGGDSVIGSPVSVTAVKGNGATGTNSASTATDGGQGGGSSGGSPSFTVVGSQGSRGLANAGGNSLGGTGGNSPFGSGGPGGANGITASGVTPGAFGAGGGGAVGSGGSGGAGKGGIVIIEWVL